MTDPSISRDLIEDAMDAVQRALNSIFSVQPEGPLDAAPEPISLGPTEQDAIRRGEEPNYRGQPAMSAVSSCLTSSISLLSIAHSLVEQPAMLSPVERDRLWKKLAVDTKVAGRAAYRAALLLSDPGAETGAYL